MPRETPSPIDLPEPEEPARPALAWTSCGLALASLFLLATNAVSLSDWIEDQPPGPLQARAAELADAWAGITQRIGIAAPRSLLHDRWKRVETARFHEERTAAGEGPEPRDQR